MSDLIRPRRSVLYVPGSNARALQKARTLPADGLIFDLEDAVVPAAKDAARQQLCEALAAGGYDPQERILRVNGLDTPWGRNDLAAAARAPIDAVLLPKVESAETVLKAERLLNEAGAPADLPLWCMIETPLGVLKVAEVAASSPRLAALVMGTSDLVKDLKARHTALRLEVLPSLGLALLAARAFRLAILDGVYLDLEDLDGFERSCRQGAELGFDGKTLIHPKTIEIANRIFAPSPEDLEQARKIIEAHAEASAQGRGVVVVDGRLVENLHVENAHRLVALEQAIARRSQD